jgi:hypothetical protein
MTTKLRILNLFLLLLSSSSLALADNNTVVSGTKATQQTSSATSADSLSFVITASEGHISPLKSGQYQLLLEGVSPYIMYFTHRPNRDSGLAATTNFVKAWDVGTHSFAADHPNGVLTSAKTNGVVNQNADAKVFELSSPKYDFNQSEMSFVITPVGDNNQLLINTLILKGVVLVVN